MFQSCSIKEPINRERDHKEFYESYSSSYTKEFKSFVEDFITDEYNEDHREDNIAVSEDSNIDQITSKDGIESKD